MTKLRDTILIAAVSGLVTAVLALGLVVLPIFMWGGPKSAEFYGSFFGSVFTVLGAVVAVILTAYYTSKNDRAREDRLRRIDQVAMAKLAYAELLSAAIGADKILRMAKDPKDDPVLSTTVASFEQSWSKLVRTPTVDKHVYDISKFDPFVATAIARILTARSLTDVVLWSLSLRDKSQPLERTLWQQMLFHFESAPIQFFAAARQIKVSQGNNWIDIDDKLTEKIKTEWRETLAKADQGFLEHNSKTA